eukprot:365352-Chlamydomonas_euryale.AAC.3
MQSPSSRMHDQSMWTHSCMHTQSMCPHSCVHTQSMQSARSRSRNQLMQSPTAACTGQPGACAMSCTGHRNADTAEGAAPHARSAPTCLHVRTWLPAVQPEPCQRKRPEQRLLELPRLHKQSPIKWGRDTWACLHL